MKGISLEDARIYAIRLVKSMLIEDSKLDYGYINGINTMLAYIEKLPEVEE